MSIITGFLYSLYFVMLGYAARACYHLMSKTQLIIERKTDFSAHAFFLGIFLHIMLFNFFQLIDISNQLALWLTLLVVVFSIILIVIHAIKYGLYTKAIKPTKYNILTLCLIGLGSLGVYWNGALLPEMAWDSWMVWIGKADQWINHGLSTPMNHFETWISSENSIFNASAHYPDGLSLLYFLPKLLIGANSHTMHVVYLIAFALMVQLLVSRLERAGAPHYLQILIVVVSYTTPLLVNHLMIAGYADIWVAMYVVLVLLTFIDFHEKGDLGVGITLLCYLLILPMLKLEGWIWLMLFALTHIIISLLNSKHAYKFIATFLALTLVLYLIGGININLPFGNVIIGNGRIEIFHLLNTEIEFVNINSEVLAGFFAQNNWSVLWFGLPFVLFSFIINQHDKASQVAHVFFILALVCFFFLFYFTKASQWALDLTAFNRVILQLVPCYIFLLFQMFNRMKDVSKTREPSTNPGH